MTGLLIRRCAWHPKYNPLWARLRLPFVIGVRWASTGKRLDFTDGMCRGCVRRFREERPDVFSRSVAGAAR